MFALVSLDIACSARERETECAWQTLRVPVFFSGIPGETDSVAKEGTLAVMVKGAWPAGVCIFEFQTNVGF